MIKVRSVILITLILIVSLASAIELPEEAVFKKVLENGLTILIVEIPGQDLVSVNIEIRAGSGTEGKYSGSGISHFVEHMVFKGTASRRAGDIEREIKSYGGFLNGGTSHDLTTFHVTVPSKHLGEILAILKDMLSNATFEPAEFDKEKEVILKEIKLNNDEPQSRLLKLLYQTAYTDHPYKYPIIGYEKAVKDLKREDLIAYYNKRYVPNKTVIAIVGGVDKEAAVSTIEKEFADLHPANYEFDPQFREPAQIGERRLEESAPISLSYLAMGFHSTSVLDKDMYAADVLSMILGRGNNSRLNKTLFKEKKLVHSVTAWNYTPKDPGLFVVAAVLDSAYLDPAEKTIMEAIEAVANGAVSEEELETAKSMALSDYILSRETLEEEARDIAGSEILTGNHDFSSRYVRGIQSVSADDLKMSAGKYLTRDNLTVVKLVPPGDKTLLAKWTKSPAKVDDRIVKEILPNGLALLVRKNSKIPAVSITVAMSGGLAAENKEDNGISNITARMLLKGTSSRKESEIEGAIEARGGSISSFSGLNSFGINLVVLKDDLDLALDLLKDVISNPGFPQEELDKQKTVTLAMIKDEDDDIFASGVYLSKKGLFGSHPYGMRAIGEPPSINALKRNDILNFYNAHSATESMVISVSGDIEYGELAKKMRSIFGDMRRKVTPQISAKVSKPDTIKARTLEMKKEESLVMMAFQTSSLNDPDRYAMDVLGSILSGSSGRLFSSLRDKRHLAYTLGCVQRRGIDAGYIIFYVATTKDRINETKDALVDEIQDIKSRIVSDDELTLAKRELETNHRIGAQTNEFYSSQSALDELYGLGYDNLYKYETEIEKVTSEDVRMVADKYLDLGAYAEVIISSMDQ